MASYPALYSKLRAELHLAKRDLIEATERLEKYRLFINESGNLHKYLLWAMERENFSQETIAVLRETFEGNARQTINAEKL